MKGGAILFKEIEDKPINANDLLYRLVHAIRLPTKYNFLTYQVGDLYKNYITIKPSGHNIDVAPEFLDFESINVFILSSSLNI